MRVCLHTTVVCFVFLVLFGCTPERTIPLPTIAPTATPTLQSKSTPTSIYHAYWNEFREPVDGWGIAVPKNWLTLPAYDFDEDFNHVSIQNYNNNFFTSEAGRKAWRDWGIEKSVKVEIFKNADYSKYASLEEGIKDHVSASEMAELVEINTIFFGEIESVRYTVRNKIDNTLKLLYAFRINRFEILVWACYPNSSWERNDIQGILASIAISRDDEIIYPDIEPGEFYSFSP